MKRLLVFYHILVLLGRKNQTTIGQGEIKFKKRKSVMIFRNLLFLWIVFVSTRCDSLSALSDHMDGCGLK
jgi:hypothetical protein